LVIRNHQLGFRKGVSFAIQRQKFFTRLGIANHHAALDSRCVIAVERLPEFEHDVVGDVNDVVDGPNTG